MDRLCCRNRRFEVVTSAGERRKGNGSKEIVSCVEDRTLAGWKMDNIRVKGVEKKIRALQFSDGQTKDYKIPSGAVWTQWLSASVSQYKITVEDAMKKKRKDRQEQLGRKCYRACVLSCIVTGWGERKDEAGVNRDRVNRKQALGFHLNLKKEKKNNKLVTLFITNIKLCPPPTCL